MQRGLPSKAAPLLGVLLAAQVHAIAQSNNPAERNVWTGVYTEAQASRGLAAYEQSCSRCHALATEGKIPLAGELFWKSFAQKSVGDLLEYVSAYMPNGNPGSLPKSAYEDIVAQMLKANGFPSGTSELGSNAIASVRIVPKDGSTELPANALARVVGCLGKSGADWVVTRATAPERAERTTGEDATRMLGNRTFSLKFVIGKLDAMVGSRVAINGLLIGTDGSEGINVTAVSRVAPKCP